MTLRQTIPLLLKHNISATPTNFAIWYTYLSNESPELESSINHILNNKMVFSKVKTKELYRDHLATNKDISGWELRRSLEAMLLELSQSLKVTRLETTNFKETMNNCVDDLAKVEKVIKKGC